MQKRPTSQAINLTVRGGVVFCALLASVGCGRTASEPSQPSETNSSKPSASRQSSGKNSAKSTAKRESDGGAAQDGAEKSSSTPEERKFVGDIPYDVFFDNPLAIAAQNEPVAGRDSRPADVATLPTGDLPEMNQTPTDSEVSGVVADSAGAGTDWKTIVPIQLIDAEVKTIRNQLNAGFQSVSKFNRAVFEIQVQAASLAALAQIVAEHPDELNWKEKAPQIRDLASEIAAGAVGSGRKVFDAIQPAFENIIVLLNGGSPADVAEAAAKVEFVEVADRDFLMKRMERSFKWLKTNVANEQALKSEAETITQEAAILAALTKAISLPGYDSVDEKEYGDYARRMLTACLTISSATSAGNYENFSKSLDQIQKSCNECHSEYRFAE